MNLRFSQDVYEKFVFQYSRLSKKATKFDEISQLIWRLQSKSQISLQISSNSSNAWTLVWKLIEKSIVKTQRHYNNKNGKCW